MLYKLLKFNKINDKMKNWRDIELIDFYLTNKSIDALNVLIDRNLNLIKVLARKNQTKTISKEDFIGEGILGLIKSVETFNNKYEAKFSTYAFFWINHYMQLFQKLNIEKSIMIYHKETDPYLDYYSQVFIALKQLSNVEQQVIEKRVFHGETLKKISETLNLSIEHIRRIQNQSYKKLAIILKNQLDIF